MIANPIEQRMALSSVRMANIDMNAFFNANTNLERKFWLIEEGNVHALPAEGEKFTIVPTQAFMVKIKGKGTKNAKHHKVLIH